MRAMFNVLGQDQRDEGLDFDPVLTVVLSGFVMLAAVLARAVVALCLALALCASACVHAGLAPRRPTAPQSRRTGRQPSGFAASRGPR